MENTTTQNQSSYGLLMTYSSALANARQELAYWTNAKMIDQKQESYDSSASLTIDEKEIEKWVSEIQKYEKLIEEFLQKTPVGSEDWFTQFSEWITKAFDVFWYIFKHLTPPSPKEREF